MADRRRPGTTVGPYTIESMLGTDATGVVYEARDLARGRTIALKVMPQPSPELARRFQREADAMVRLEHHNVVSVFEVGETDGEAFVAMERVHGCTLREWLATPHPLPEILGLFLQVSAGLAAAHDAGIVHRDFKPEHVFVGDDGVVRVGDFGLTLPGDVAGPRADQYHLAAALLEAAGTRAPFRGDSTDPAAAVRPRRLARAIARGLAPDPDHRFADMRAFGGELHAVLTAPADRFVRLGRASILAFAALVIVVVRVACC